MQKTFETILREKMAVPVAVKGKDATVLPMEAMVMNVMHMAMTQSLAAISAINFIRAITEQHDTDDDIRQREQAAHKLADTESELLAELHADGLDVPQDMAELELIARQLVTLRRIADIMDGPAHRDVIITPQRNGSERTELSATNRIFNDLYKQWKADWQALRQSLVNRQMQKRMLNKK